MAASDDESNKALLRSPSNGARSLLKTPSFSAETLGLVRPDLASFTEAEVDAFVRLAEFATPNPRKIKRITNLYILARLLAPPDAGLRDKLVAWIFICELWPVRMTWILQVITDNSHLVADNPLDKHMDMPLYEFFVNHVEHVLFNTMHALPESASTIVQQYTRAYTSLDVDPELFEKMLRKVDLTIGDVGTLLLHRDRTKLTSYTLNLNPGLRDLVSRLASFRINSSSARDMQGIVYVGQTILGDSAKDCASAKKIQTGGTVLDMSRNVERQTRATKHNQDRDLPQAGKNFKDDKSGDDHIGYAEYAMVLSQLIVNFIELPCTFGLFAVWGAGKSFTMNKIETYIVATFISKLIHAHSLEHGADESHAALVQEIQSLAKDDESIKLLYSWLVGGCNEAAIKPGTSLTGLDRTVVKKALSLRQAAPVEETDVFSVVAYIVAVLFSVVSLLYQCVQTTICRSVNPRLEFLRRVWKEQCGESDVEYEFVWFNAWLFCGSDNLWAGLVLKLHEAVESHYGPSYAQAQHRANLIASTLKILLAGLALIIGMLFYKSTDLATLEEESTLITQDFSLLSANILKKFVGLSVSGASIGAAGQQILKILRSSTTPSASISNRASQANFKSKLGFMEEVKNEIDMLSGYLNDPETVPTFWDALAPPSWKFTRMLLTWLKKMFASSGKRRPCRLVIFVDDLDRVPPTKILEVLQAITLLSEGTPFIFFLAIDPRVIVNAIENDNDGFLREAGVGGYDYLDKVVGLPFSFPPLSDFEKAKLFRGFLTGNAEANHVEFTDADGDVCRYELKPDKAGIAMKINGGSTFTGKVQSFSFSKGRLSDSNGTAPLPYSVADSILRQIMDLSKRAKPPVEVKLGGADIV